MGLGWEPGVLRGCKAALVGRVLLCGLSVVASAWRLLAGIGLHRGSLLCALLEGFLPGQFLCSPLSFLAYSSLVFQCKSLLLLISAACYVDEVFVRASASWLWLCLSYGGRSLTKLL